MLKYTDRLLSIFIKGMQKLCPRDRKLRLWIFQVVGSGHKGLYGTVDTIREAIFNREITGDLLIYQVAVFQKVKDQFINRRDFVFISIL